MVSNERERFKERLGKVSWQQNVWLVCNETILILAFEQPWNIVNFLQKYTLKFEILCYHGQDEDHSFLKMYGVP